MNIHEKIVEISNELRIAKDGNNEFKGFRYFKPDDIAQAINPLLKKHNIIILFDLPFNKIKEMYEGKLTIKSTETGENSGEVIYQFDIPLTSVAAASPAQNAGATLTYCKRYMIMSAFNIADNQADPDAEQQKEKGRQEIRKEKVQGLAGMTLTELEEYKVNLKKSTRIKEEDKPKIIAKVEARIKELKNPKSAK